MNFKMPRFIFSIGISCCVCAGLFLFFSACSSGEDEEPVPENEDVFINEVYSSGDDWLELYNTSDDPKNIGGYFIFDDETNKYTIPANTTIPAKGFLVLYCDDTGTGLHTNFKLSADGETVYLENASGTLIDKVEFPVLDNGQSYGRYPDGSSTLAISGNTSQGSSNDDASAPAIESVSRTPKVPGLDEAVLVQAKITSVFPIASVKLFYRFNGDAYTEVAMTLSGEMYNATIPAQGATGEVDYYVEARNSSGIASRNPWDAPDDAHDYLLNTDPLPDLKINEFMATNTSCCPDTDAGGGVQEFDDWIELYNAGDTPVDIGGMYLSDDKTDPFKSKIPDDNPVKTTIPAGGYLLLWADETSEQGPLHLNFKLSTGGEDVALFYIDGREIDAYTYGTQADNKSFGRSGDTWQQFASPTPGQPNQ